MEENKCLKICLVKIKLKTTQSFADITFAEELKQQKYVIIEVATNLKSSIWN